MKYELTEKDLPALNELLDRNYYALNEFYNSLDAEQRDFEKHGIAKYKQPTVIDLINCVFVGNGRYQQYREEEYFTILNSRKYGLDYSIPYKKISWEGYGEIRLITLDALEALKMNIEQEKDVSEPSECMEEK